MVFFLLGYTTIDDEISIELTLYSSTYKDLLFSLPSDPI